MQNQNKFWKVVLPMHAYSENHTPKTFAARWKLCRILNFSFWALPKCYEFYFLWQHSHDSWMVAEKDVPGLLSCNLNIDLKQTSMSETYKNKLFMRRITDVVSVRPSYLTTTNAHVSVSFSTKRKSIIDFRTHMIQIQNYNRIWCSLVFFAVSSKLSGLTRVVLGSSLFTLPLQVPSVRSVLLFSYTHEWNSRSWSTMACQ